MVQETTGSGGFTIKSIRRSLWSIPPRIGLRILPRFLPETAGGSFPAVRRADTALGAFVRWFVGVRPTHALGIWRRGKRAPMSALLARERSLLARWVPLRPVGGKTTYIPIRPPPAQRIGV